MKKAITRSAMPSLPSFLLQALFGYQSKERRTNGANRGKSMTIRALVVLACLVPCYAAMSPAAGEEVKFDVNDVSYLWPAPKTKEDVAALLSADDKLSDDASPIWPKTAFDTVI